MWLQKGLLYGISGIFLITVIIQLCLGKGEHQLILLSGFLLCYLPWAFEAL